jgi:hypothetical protein
MISIKHITLAALLAGAAAFAVPSAALAGKSHHTSVYKVEDHVELEGEDGEYTLSCKATDIAIDGMWRLDNVDQDNDWADPDPALSAFWAPVLDGGIGTSPDLTIRKAVRPMAAYADAADPSKYHFAFTPLGGADVQIKLFLTCLPNPLTGFGHSHNWRFTIDPGQKTDSTAAHAPATDPFDTPNANGTCPAKTILIQPGFETAFTNHHIVTSRPDYNTTWNFRNWEWTVWSDGTGPAGTADFTWRCLDVKSSPHPGPVTGHTHKLVYNLKTTDWDGVPASDLQIGKQQVAERQQHCSEHYKGMIGGWDISDAWRTASAGPPAYPHHMWIYFLGMDPRIKSRAFSFLNLDEIPGTVSTYLACWKDRTT